MRLGYILRPFPSPFPPSRARTKLSSSLVIQRKVVTRNRKDKAATALQCTRSTNQLGRTLGHTPSSKHIMDPRGQHANSRRTNSHNISRSRPPESPLGVAFGIKVEVGGGKGGAIRGTKLARSRHLFTWLYLSPHRPGPTCLDYDITRQPGHAPRYFSLPPAPERARRALFPLK